jgi:hypothetical protein
MAASRSSVIAASDADRARVRAAVRGIADAAEEGRAVRMPYRTHAYRLRMGGAAP